MSNSQSYAVYLASGEDSIQHKEHIYQFQNLANMIAREVCEEYMNTKVEAMVNNAVSKAIQNAFSGAMSGISLDVARIVDITVEGLSKQYHSKEVDKFLTDALGEELRKALSNIDVSLIIS